MEQNPVAMKSISISSPMRLRVLSGLLIFSVLGCSGQALRLSGEPDWVQRKSGAFLDRNQKSFYGVGVISKGGSRISSRVNADQEARAEIAKLFQFYAAALMQDYVASTVTLRPEAERSPQDIEALIKTFSATSLSAVVIIDHWFDPRGGVYYSLARLNLDSFQEKIKKARKLNTGVRGFVSENAQKIFNALEQEEVQWR